MTAQRCYTKSGSEVKPLSVDSRETILFIIPPAYCNTRPNFITCKNLRYLLRFEGFFLWQKEKHIHVSQRDGVEQDLLLFSDLINVKADKLSQ